jgi:hypothetical protein
VKKLVLWMAIGAAGEPPGRESDQSLPHQFTDADDCEVTVYCMVGDESDGT